MVSSSWKLGGRVEGASPGRSPSSWSSEVTGGTIHGCSSPRGCTTSGSGDDMAGRGRMPELSVLADRHNDPNTLNDPTLRRTGQGSWQTNREQNRPENALRGGGFNAPVGLSVCLSVALGAGCSRSKRLMITRVRAPFELYARESPGRHHSDASENREAFHDSRAKKAMSPGQTLCLEDYPRRTGTQGAREEGARKSQRRASAIAGKRKPLAVVVASSSVAGA